MIDTGGQAFPKQQWEYDGQNNVLQYQEDGMTLRDYFAAKAMAALIVTPHSLRDLGLSPINGMDVPAFTAVHAYQMADEMIKARNNHD